MSNLALSMTLQSNYSDAEPLFRRALEVRERVLGADDPETLSMLMGLPYLLECKGDYERAEALYRRALAGYERVLGPEHPDTLVSVSNLAGLLRSTGAYAEAEPLFRRALAARERVLGPEHPSTLTSVKNLALLLQRTGAYAEAEPLCRRALAGRERVLGPEHPDTLTSARGLADVLERTGRADDARSLPERRLRMIASNHDVTPMDLRTAALDAYQLSDYPLATTLLQRVLDAGFEIPGTCCHLARIALLLDEVPSARGRVAQAWEQRGGAPPYVIPRILWLELACVLLTDADRTATAVSPARDRALGRLKSALQVPGAQMGWAMDPVLDHLRSRLPAEAHALLTALVATLGNPGHLAALDALPAWREARSEPLE